MKKWITCLCIILLLQSCEEQTDWQLQPGNLDFVVVDGIITDEMRYQTIQISKPVSEINEPAQPVSNATVLVSTDQNIYTFHEQQEHKGMYISDEAFSGINEKTYSLNITIGSNLYSAKAILKPAENTPFIGYEKNSGDENFHLSPIPFPYNPDLSAMYEILLDWSAAPGYENISPELCKARLYYYVLQTLDVSEVFAPGMEKISFPAGTIFTQKRYSLTEQHAAFIRALLLETTWQGGFFNTATANIPTNLSSGAIGFFGACGVIEKVEVVNK
jgi:hypothetical protein